MARFAKVKPSFWRRKDLRAIGSLSKLLAIYLLTNENIRMTGLYRLSKHTMMHELDLDTAQLKYALQELIARDFCRYDEEEEVIWVVDMALSQVAENPNEKQLKGIENELRDLADSDFPFVNEFFNRYENEFALGIE